MLLPNWFYINIYEMSSWTRGIVIPMAILYALRLIPFAETALSMSYTKIRRRSG